MAKKKSKESETVPAATEAKKTNRSGFPINAWLPADLGAAFKTYLESLEPSPTATAAVTLAMREFLTKRGFWPPRDA